MIACSANSAGCSRILSAHIGGALTSRSTTRRLNIVQRMFASMAMQTCSTAMSCAWRSLQQVWPPACQWIFANSSAMTGARAQYVPHHLRDFLAGVPGLLPPLPPPGVGGLFAGGSTSVAAPNGCPAGASSCSIAAQACFHGASPATALSTALNAWPILLAQLRCSSTTAAPCACTTAQGTGACCTNICSSLRAAAGSLNSAATLPVP
jgi:hypothetical protein